MQNKLLPGILIGATIGGAIALIDKNTRRSLKSSVHQIKTGERSNEPSKFAELKDEFFYWKDTIDEIRRNNPELERSLRQAKDTFVERKNNKQIGL
ncbi:YtxH domain-containing protein [Staphylococcus schleiferi subsp. coagulans]|uniref:YtxH domain-containing protein n=1 Tax=Staphylococcus coagulans TaxID=74706 RepID=UPI0015FB4B5D|nr:YtxH domain-containing protein [Staphylococcus coagulans]MBA8779133.1 YtxH domain-containing protein [Staphylococcus coagulans]